MKVSEHYTCCTVIYQQKAITTHKIKSISKTKHFCSLYIKPKMLQPPPPSFPPLIPRINNISMLLSTLWTKTNPPPSLTSDPRLLPKWTDYIEIEFIPHPPYYLKNYFNFYRNTSHSFLVLIISPILLNSITQILKTCK